MATCYVALSYDSMTMMPTTQVPEATVSLDAVMPRPAPGWKVGVLLACLVTMAVGGWWARWEGGWAPRLKFGANEFSSGVQHGRPFLSGDFVSAGSFPVTITHVDATVPGLGSPSVTFESASGRRLRLPLHLGAGASVYLSIVWRRLECRLIRPGDAYYMPVSYENVAGIPGTVDMVPLWWMRPGSTVSGAPTVPSGVGWPLGVAWLACGRPPAAAPAALPASP